MCMSNLRQQEAVKAHSFLLGSVLNELNGFRLITGSKHRVNDVTSTEAECVSCCHSNTGVTQEMSQTLNNPENSNMENGATGGAHPTC